MALTFGNMDQQVQQQADAFSDNPAALQQRYQQSQQLLDLLALQKIKSDKEAAAREMQMQMEQRPQTIAQQREAEVMGLTKDELAKQMGGIMAQRQAAEQSNIKRAASGQPPRQRMAMAPPMRNPRTEGVASQRADNMVNMAQGGIVGFEPGGRVEGGVTDEQLKAMNVSKEVFEGLTPERRERLLRTIDPNRSEFGADVARSVRERILMDAALEANMSRPDPFERLVAYFGGDRAQSEAIGQRGQDATRRADALSALAAQPAPGFQPPNAAPNAAVPGSLAGLEASALGDMYAPGPGPGPGPGAPAPQLSAPQLSAPATAASQMAGISAAMPAGQRAVYRDPTKTAQGEMLQKERQIIAEDFILPAMKRDPAAERATREAGVGTLLGRDRRMDMYNQLMADREALIKRQNEARSKFGPLGDLLASPRAGGTTFGRIGQDLYRGQQNLFAKEQRDLDYLYRMAKNREEADIEAGKAQVVAGTEAQRFAETDVQNARRDAQSLLSERRLELSEVAKGYLDADRANMTAEAAERSDRVKMAVSQADNAVKTDIANLESQVQTQRNQIEREKLSQMSDTKRQELLGTVMNMIGKLRAGYDEIMQKAIQNDLILQGLKGEKKQAAEKRIRDQYAALRDESIGELQGFQDNITASLSGGTSGFKVNR
jgi:hypothetical protein